jgi:hypothetical protein
MTTEVLTGYTKVDPSAFIAEPAIADRTTVTAMTANVLTYLYKDFGANYFSNSFSALATMQVTASTGTAGAREMQLAWSQNLGAYGTDVNSLIAREYVPAAGTTVVLYAYKLESSAGVSVAPSTSGVKATIYYIRTGLYSSLGKFGGFIAQAFTDAGRTALLSNALTVRTANAAYRYFYAMRSENTGGADTISGYNELITLSNLADGLNLTAFTAVGIASYADVVANCTTITALPNNIAAYRSKNYGAGGIADFTASGAFVPSAISSSTNGVNYATLTSVCDSAAEFTTIANGIGIRLQSTGTAATVKLALVEKVAGTEYLSTFSGNLPTARQVFTNLDRTGTALTLKLYNDPDLLSQIGTTLTLTAHNSTLMQYLFDVQSGGPGGTGQTSGFTIGGVTLANRLVVVASRSDADAFTGVLTKISTPVASRSDADTFTGVLTKISTPVASRADADTFTAVSLYATGTTPVASRSDADAFTGVLTKISTPVASRSDADVFTAIATKIGFGVSVLSRSDADVFTGIATSTNGFVQQITWRLINSSNAPVTGAAPTISWERNADGYFYDFNDSTFKASAWVTIAGVMTAVNATVVPGAYRKNLSTYQLNGTYTLYPKYTGATAADNDYGIPIELIIADGIVVNYHLLAPTVQEIRADLDASSSRLAGIPVLQASVNALPTTPAPTAAQITSAVWANPDAVKMRKIATNKKITDPITGIMTVYEDDSAAVAFTAQLWEDAAGTIKYRGQGFERIEVLA